MVYNYHNVKSYMVSSKSVPTYLKQCGILMTGLHAHLEYNMMRHKNV